MKQFVKQIKRYYDERKYSEVNYLLTELDTFGSLVPKSDGITIYGNLVEELNKTCNHSYDQYDNCIRENVRGKRGMD